MTGIHIRGTLDGHLDLLDRQIVSSNGRMIAKVDDIELEERADGSLIVSGLLVGPGALGPRLGGALGHVAVSAWSRLAGRPSDDPRRIDYSHVTDIATVLTVDEERAVVDVDGLETWARTRVVAALPGASGSADSMSADQATSSLGSGPPRSGTRHRFTELVGMRVQLSDGDRGGQVIDVRFGRGDARGHLPRLRTEGLIVGRNRPGSLFGYDRRRQQGPWLIQMILRFVHRRTGYVSWSDVTSIDWSDRVLTLRTAEAEQLDDL